MLLMRKSGKQLQNKAANNRGITVTDCVNDEKYVPLDLGNSL